MKPAFKLASIRLFVYFLVFIQRFVCLMQNILNVQCRVTDEGRNTQTDIDIIRLSVRLVEMFGERFILLHR